MLFIRPTLLASIAATAVSLAVVAPVALAVPPAKTSKKSSPDAQYECQKCYMRYSAAVAKKDKFIDPMDGGKLTPVKAPAKKVPAAKSNKPKM